MNNLKKIVEYGLYLLAFLLPIQTRWIIKPGELNGGYWEYGTVGLYATDILLLIILFLFIFFKLQECKMQKSKCKVTIKNLKLFSNFYIWLFIVIIDLAIFISMFFAPNKLLAVYRYGVFLLGIGLFWLIVSADYNKVKLFWSLIAAAILQAGLGIWQFLMQSSFSSKWLGMAEHNPFDLGTSVVETAGLDGIMERWLRAYGGLDHPNILGGLLAVSLLLLIILFINAKSETISNFQFPISNFKIVFLFSCFLVFLSALFFTFSRGAWAGFITGLLTMLVILLWRKDGAAQKKLLKIVGTGFVIVLVLFSLYSDLVLTRLSRDTRLEIRSNIERIDSYKYAVEIIKKHWLSGAGMGNYTLVLRNEIADKQQSYFYQPVHNTFLLIWAETGILGLAGFLGLMGYIIIFNFSTKGGSASGGQFSIIKQFLSFKKILNSKFEIRNSEQNYSDKGINKNCVLLLPILSALIVMMLVDHWWWSLHFGGLFFWLTMGLIAKNENF